MSASAAWMIAVACTLRSEIITASLIFAVIMITYTYKRGTTMIARDYDLSGR